jgi:N-acetyl-gamma-glutamyl-phosphate reductase
LRVYIDGAAGAAGVALEDVLSGLGYVEFIRVDEGSRKDTGARRACLNAADVAFLCLPDDAAREAVALTENPDTVIIDASTAHRTAAGWAYGFPELSRGHYNAVKASNRIAVPGCHASGFSALVYPAVRGGFLDPDGPVFCQSLTGYSGGGKAMIAEYESGAPSAAKLYATGLAHKHLPEMQYVCGLKHPPVFMPVLINVKRGMVTCVPLAGVPARDVWAYMAAYYDSAAAVRVMPFGEYAGLEIDGMNHTNAMEIHVFGNDSQTILAARFDNLGKGAAGAAAQCMKVRMGYET